MTATVLRADARHLPLPDASVDLVVTSPPYFGLRSYTDGGQHYAGQLGSEPTPAAFIESLLDCTREMVRVLKPTGSIFVNLGDRYNSAKGGQNDTGHTTLSSPNGTSRITTDRDRALAGRGTTVASAPVKSLLLLPERYRIACVDQLGLIARAVVIWSKPNGLPESVTDRVRRSHEDWVHLTKKPRYFAAVDEVREPHKLPNDERWKRQTGSRYDGAMTGSINSPLNPLGKLPGSVWEIATQPLTVPAELGIDHFAAFPMEWPRRIILGWSPPGICVECGEGRRPIAEPTGETGRHPGGGGTYRAMRGAGEKDTNLANAALRVREITGYACGCPPCPKCDDSRQSWLAAGKPCHGCPPTRPAVVLDPFGGTGTTALLADVLGRHGVSVDMSADYCRLAQWRTTDPGQRALAMGVPKPAPVADDQLTLWAPDGEAVAS